MASVVTEVLQVVWEATRWVARVQLRAQVAAPALPWLEAPGTGLTSQPLPGFPTSAQCVQGAPSAWVGSPRDRLVEVGFDLAPPGCPVAVWARTRAPKGAFPLPQGSQPGVHAQGQAWVCVLSETLTL